MNSTIEKIYVLILEETVCIDNSSMNFDPINQDKSINGVFNNFVDLLVIKNF